MKQALASSNPSIGADIIKKDGVGPQKPDSETMWTQRIMITSLYLFDHISW